jgi:molybdopterin-guanine dinucleotide biosynthesis protein A
MATAFASASGEGAHAGFRNEGRDAQPDTTVPKAPLPQGGFPEPLCTIYEPGFRVRLLELAAQGKHCPRKALLNSPCRILPSPETDSLANINRPEEFLRAQEELSRSRLPPER